MPNKPTSTHRTTDVISKLQQAADDDDKTIETFAQVDTTRPLQARNGEHGHVTDGPRGLETFHAHDDPPGDVAHGHKRGRGLDWTAAVTDYVPPFSAATAPNVAAPEVDPTPAASDRTGTEDATPDAARASEPALTGGSGGTAGSGRPIRARNSLGQFVAADSQPPRVELRRIHRPDVPVSVALEHALIDADVALWKAAMHLRLERARTILATLRFEAEADQLEETLAVKAGMLVRLGSDGGTA